MHPRGRNAGVGTPPGLYSHDCRVVTGKPLRIAQDLIGLGDLLKAPCSIGVVRMGIGVGPMGQPPVGPSDIGPRGAWGHIEPPVQAVPIRSSVHTHI